MSSGFFFELTPDRVLQSVEASGLRCTGRCAVMNSFENRVYEVELDSDEKSQADSRSYSTRKIVKFYRPGRWTSEQILEEHQFLLDLQQEEIPVVAPQAFPDGNTLHVQSESGILYAVFPKVGGRAPDELNDEQLLRLGRLLARIHQVGVSRKAPSRLRLTPTSYGLENLQILLSGDWVPTQFHQRYESVVKKICQRVERWFDAVASQRIHGDCHLGNLLWNSEGPFFLDFDDMVSGPAVQDLWLLIPGRDVESQRQLQVLLRGYEEMRAFDRSELRLIEALRALRMIHYSAWIARRWKDPAFPIAFPAFGSERYWAEETIELETQWGLLSQMEGQ